MKSRIFILLVLFPGIVLAQSSLLQDEEGESGFKSPAGNIVLNTKDAGISLNYFRLKSIPDKAPRSFGINLKLKGKDGIAPVISDGKFDPEGTLGVFFIFYVPNRKVFRTETVIETVSTPMADTFRICTLCDTVKYIVAKPPRVTRVSHNEDILMQDVRQNYFTVTPKLKWSQVSLLDTANVFQSPTHDSPVGASLEVAFSRIGFAGAWNNASPIIFGISATIGVVDNASSLDLLKFDRLDTRYNPKDSSQTLVGKKEITGHNRDAFKKSMTYSTLNVDWGIYPRVFNNRILIAAHWRSKFIDENSHTNLGAGIYLAKEKAPGKIIGGINFLVNDVFNQMNQASSVINRASVNLVLGVNPF
jgi:hypothetical protein